MVLLVSFFLSLAQCGFVRVRVRVRARLKFRSVCEMVNKEMTRKSCDGFSGSEKGEYKCDELESTDDEQAKSL